jgi:hypothetical protein
MGKAEHSVDELFRLVLKDQETPPPADAWNNIEKTMNSRKRVRLMWTIRALAAVITLMITFASGYFIANFKNHSKLSEYKQSTKTEAASAQSRSAFNNTIQKETKQKQANPPTSEINNRLNHQINSIQLVVTDSVKSGTPPGTALGDAEENSMLAYLQPIQIILKANKSYYPGDSALESYTIGYNEFAGEEIVLGEKNDSDQAKGSLSRWSLGGQVSPLYAYRETSESGMKMASNNQYISGGGQQESGIISYSGGMNVEYKASKRLSISSGLYYSRMGQNINGSEYSQVISNYDLQAFAASTSSQSAIYSFNNSTGILNLGSAKIKTAAGGSSEAIFKTGAAAINATGYQSASLMQTLDFLELPVLVRYKIIDKKVGLHLLGGLSTHMLVGNKLILDSSSGKQDLGSTASINTFNYSSTLGLGLDYAISTRIQINLEPAFKYYINSINSSVNVETHPYSFGIYTGMRYNF